MHTPDLRFIIYHKQSTSARTLFLRWDATGSVLTPSPLPQLSLLVEDAPPPLSTIHPATLASRLAETLGLTADFLEVETDYHAQVETPSGLITIYLARFTTIDPPRQWSSAAGGNFCAITELRGGHLAEMMLLRQAYEHVLG